jgi:hypothetical protein
MASEKSGDQAQEDEPIRAFARQLWNGQRSTDQVFAGQVDTYLETIPLELRGMPYCRVCESVLCGVCGRCHEDTKRFVFIGPTCPVAVPNTEQPGCLAWTYAYQFLSAARRAQKASNPNDRDA